MSDASSSQSSGELADVRIPAELLKFVAEYNTELRRFLFSFENIDYDCQVFSRINFFPGGARDLISKVYDALKNLHDKNKEKIDELYELGVPNLTTLLNHVTTLRDCLFAEHEEEQAHIEHIHEMLNGDIFIEAKAQQQKLDELCYSSVRSLLSENESEKDQKALKKIGSYLEDERKRLNGNLSDFLEMARKSLLTGLHPPRRELQHETIRVQLHSLDLFYTEIKKSLEQLLSIETGGPEVLMELHEIEVQTNEFYNGLQRIFERFQKEKAPYEGEDDLLNQEPFLKHFFESVVIRESLKSIGVKRKETSLDASDIFRLRANYKDSLGLTQHDPLALLKFVSQYQKTLEKFSRCFEMFRLSDESQRHSSARFVSQAYEHLSNLHNENKSVLEALNTNTHSPLNLTEIFETANVLCTLIHHADEKDSNKMMLEVGERLNEQRQELNTVSSSFLSLLLSENEQGEKSKKIGSYLESERKALNGYLGDFLQNTVFLLECVSKEPARRDMFLGYNLKHDFLYAEIEKLLEQFFLVDTKVEEDLTKLRRLAERIHEIYTVVKHISKVSQENKDPSSQNGVSSLFQKNPVLNSYFKIEEKPLAFGGSLSTITIQEELLKSELFLLTNYTERPELVKNDSKSLLLESTQSLESVQGGSSETELETLEILRNAFEGLDRLDDYIKTYGEMGTQLMQMTYANDLYDTPPTQDACSELLALTYEIENKTRTLSAGSLSPLVFEIVKESVKKAGAAVHALSINLKKTPRPEDISANTPEIEKCRDSINECSCDLIQIKANVMKKIAQMELGEVSRNFLRERFQERYATFSSSLTRFYELTTQVAALAWKSVKSNLDPNKMIEIDDLALQINSELDSWYTEGMLRHLDENPEKITKACASMEATQDAVNELTSTCRELFSAQADILEEQSGYTEALYQEALSLEVPSLKEYFLNLDTKNPELAPCVKPEMISYLPEHEDYGVAASSSSSGAPSVEDQASSSRVSPHSFLYPSAPPDVKKRLGDLKGEEGPEDLREDKGPNFK